MTKKQLAEQMKKGISMDHFNQDLAERKEQVDMVSNIVTILVSVEASISNIRSSTMILGMLAAGVDGMVIAGVPKEDALRIVSERYDELLQKREEFLQKVDADPEYGEKKVKIEEWMEQARDSDDAPMPSDETNFRDLLDNNINNGTIIIPKNAKVH